MKEWCLIWILLSRPSQYLYDHQVHLDSLRSLWTPPCPWGYFAWPQIDKPGHANFRKVLPFPAQGFPRKDFVLGIRCYPSLRNFLIQKIQFKNSNFFRKFRSCLPNRANVAWRANWSIRIETCFPTLTITSLSPISMRSKPAKFTIF